MAVSVASFSTASAGSMNTMDMGVCLRDGLGRRGVGWDGNGR